MMNKIRNTVIFTFVAFSGMSQVNQSNLDGGSLGLNTITTAVPFMSITPDSRAGAMGDAGTALSASSTSIYWNTSMLTFAEEKSAISISYTPWLRQLTNDIHLSYLSGYYKINDRHAVGGSLRYFNLGEITFTDESANIIREDKPSEFEITGGYAFRLSDKMSVGINGKFVYSNLTGGLPVAGVETKPGVAGATDISFTYSDDDAKIGSTRGTYNFAATINNVGNKIAYSSVSSGFRDFLPMNLKIGNAFVADFDAYNKVTFSLDVQKLLVPTPPTYAVVDGETVRIAGRDNNVGVISGMLQSFYDAPGVVLTDEVSGDYLQNEDGSYQIKSGSRFLEELTEINLAAGMEWWYNDVFALRGGFFFEHNNKGARQYFNLGAGFKYNKFGIDISYLAALKRNNPLANTLRFTLRMVLGDSDSSSSTAPE
ncbi:MAG: type IX secretion system outer membrane channel protein PorV [Crocinitomicaceae bacterium]|nr:type IX secretion system outer membrane channel protein PorV [Crocinitomicaceae bacterium]